MTTKTLQTLKSELLADFEVKLFDYHIRGCQLANGRLNQICERHRSKDMDWFSSAIDRVAREAAEAILSWIKSNGTVIHKGELPKAIHGILIDFEKLSLKRDKWLKGEK